MSSDDGQLELTDRQRERFDAIKEECTDDHLPEPTDQQIMKSLLDTWQAVKEGRYSEYQPADAATTEKPTDD